MNRGVAYYVSGVSRGERAWQGPVNRFPHAFYLAVSLYALRKHYRGPVAILATYEGNGKDLGEPMYGLATDRRLDAWLVPFPLLTAEGGNYSKGAGEFYREMITKAGLHRYTPFDLTLFIDADTVPVADPSPLFDQCPPGHVLLTTRGMTPDHLIAWRKFAVAAQCVQLVEEHRRQGWPAINTGVLAYWKDSSALEPAFELAMKGGTSGQLGMQFTYPHHPHVLVDDQWNWTPPWCKATEPKILHGIGYRLTMPGIRERWLPAFREAWEEDIAGIRQWGREEAGRWLDQSFKDRRWLAVTRRRTA